MPEARHLTSRDNPLLVRLRKLAAEPAAYRKLGVVWLEGEHLCSAWRARGCAVPQAVVTEAAWEDRALRRIASHADAVFIVSAALMAGVSALESSPPLAFCVPWTGEAPLEPGVSSLVLDRLQDPGNVGNLLRSASAFGFKQVLALKGTVALWSPKVLRAGMGAHFGLRLLEGLDAKVLADLGVPLLAGSSHAQQALHQAALPWPCAWLLGHEGQGVAPALLGRCAHVLRIAQPGGEESLNVAAAGAVCLYESMRQRGAA